MKLHCLEKLESFNKKMLEELFEKPRKNWNYNINTKERSSFKEITGYSREEYWNDKDEMDQCRYELDKESGLLLGDDVFYAEMN